MGDEDLEEVGEAQGKVQIGANRTDNLESITERQKIDVDKVFLEGLKAKIFSGSEMLLNVYRKLVEENRDKLIIYKDDIENCYLVAKAMEIFWKGEPYDVALRGGDDLELPKCEITRELEVTSIPLKKLGELFDESVETSEDMPEKFTAVEQERLGIKVTLAYLLPKKRERILYTPLPLSEEWKEFRDRKMEKTQALRRNLSDIGRKKGFGES